MSKIKTLLASILVFCLVCSVSYAANYKTESGRFKISYTDDRNLDENGNVVADLTQFRVGVLAYDWTIVDEANAIVFQKRYFKPVTSNVVIMQATLENEGNYLATLKIKNLILESGKVTEYSVPPNVVHNILFEKPEPPTPTPTPIPEPTPTPIPALPGFVPIPAVDENFSFEDLPPVQETDFGNETDFGGTSGGGSIDGLLELLK